jgi:D-glycero-D-manno-heptose 1,7-bisphosphate phosphatase
LKLVILDRDGVINHDSAAYVMSVQEGTPIPGSIVAIAQLSRAGGRVAAATNQSGIARGYYDLATLDAMHARLRELVAEQGGEVGLIVYCPHGPNEDCDCRKPKPGMLHIIANHYAVDLRGIWFVGDSKGDLEAAVAVDSQPVLVMTGKGHMTRSNPLPAGTLIFDDLAAVAAELIHNSASLN